MLDADVIAIVATQTGQSPTTMTTQVFWKAVAQMGSYLARHSDGPPGWKPLWKGWLRVQTLLEGVHLAFHLRLSCVYKRQPCEWTGLPGPGSVSIPMCYP